MIRRVLVLAVLAVALPLPAHADDVVAYETEGDAAAAGSDPRVAALDDAFSRAATSALADLVPAAVRTARQADLDREIVRHARLWVVNYAVTRDETNDDRRQLAVSVRIDRDKIRARLAELGIATQDVAPDTAAPSHTTTVLLRIAAPGGVRADYGQTAERDLPGLAALTGVLRDAGMAVRRAPAGGPPARADGDLPLDDAAAGALAAGANAELALIAGVSVGPPVPVRGQPGTAALVTAHEKLLGKGGAALGQGTGTSVARGDDPGQLGYAIDRALRAAAADALPPAPTRLAQAGAYHGDDAPVAAPGMVLVRLPAMTPFSLVLDEQRYLAGARGVRAATLRRLSPSGWVIGVVTGLPIEKIAQIARRPPATDTTPSVKIAGDLVEVSLAGAP